MSLKSLELGGIIYIYIYIYVYIYISYTIYAKIHWECSEIKQNLSNNMTKNIWNAIKAFKAFKDLMQLNPLKINKEVQKVPWSRVFYKTSIALLI